MKKIIVCSLVGSLLINSAAYSGPKGEAYTYVAKTEEAARAHAQNLLLTYVKDSAANMKLQAVENEALVSAVQKMDESSKKINILLDAFSQAKPSNEQLSFMNIDDLDQLYSELNNLYIKTRAAETVRDHQILSGMSKVASLYQDIEYARQSVLKVCREGVASNLHFSELPAVRPVPPAFNINFSGQLNSQGEGSLNPPEFAVNGEGLEWVTPVSMAASAAAVQFGGMSMVAGLGVGTAIAIIAYGVAMTEAINQSRDVTDALWIVFDNKADAETVRAEFKKLCEPLVTKLENIPNRMTLLRANDVDTVNLYKQQKNKVNTVMAELEKLSKAIHVKELELTEKAVGSTDTEKKKWVEVEMLKTEERQAYLDYMKDVDQTVFFDMLEITLIELSRSYEAVQEDIYKYLDKIFESQMKKYNKDLNSMISIIRKLRFKPATLAAIKEEAELYGDLAAAYREFDMAFAEYIDDLFKLGQTVDSRERLENWLKLSEDLAEKYPTSISAKVLEAQAQQVIRMLEL